jgi:hypothetical protein
MNTAQGPEPVSSFIRRKLLDTFLPHNKNPAGKDRKGVDRHNGFGL